MLFFSLKNSFGEPKWFFYGITVEGVHLNALDVHLYFKPL